MERELNLGDLVAGLKEKTGYSNDSLASAIGISPRSIDRYLAGGNPGKSAGKKIADKILSFIEARGYDLYSLFGFDGPDYLFHGSKTGIIGPISARFNEEKSVDFGSGFYLSETFKTAVTYVCNRSNPKIYRFDKSQVLRGRIYQFGMREEDVKNWVLFIGLNRHKITRKEDEALFREYFFHLFKGYDVLKGVIADSYNFDVLEAFFEGDYDIKQVGQALKQVAIGDQIVMKNDVLAQELTPLDTFTLEKDLRETLLEMHRRQTRIYRAFNKEGLSKEEADPSLKFTAIKKEIARKLKGENDES